MVRNKLLNELLYSSIVWASAVQLQNSYGAKVTKQKIRENNAKHVMGDWRQHSMQ